MLRRSHYLAVFSSLAVAVIPPTLNVSPGFEWLSSAALRLLPLSEETAHLPSPPQPTMSSSSKSPPPTSSSEPSLSAWQPRDALASLRVCVHSADWPILRDILKYKLEAVRECLHGGRAWDRVGAD